MSHYNIKGSTLFFNINNENRFAESNHAFVSHVPITCFFVFHNLSVGIKFETNRVVSLDYLYFPSFVSSMEI